MGIAFTGAGQAAQNNLEDLHDAALMRTAAAWLRGETVDWGRPSGRLAIGLRSRWAPPWPRRRPPLAS
jgi:hypothetical protein